MLRLRLNFCFLIENKRATYLETSYALLMDVVPIELFGVSIDLPLPKPVSMRSTMLEDFARDLCDPLKGIGVRPAQCQLVGRDLLYQYELNATFFEGNGTLVRTPERLRVAVRNARNWADWQLVHQTFCRVHALVELDSKSVSSLAMQAQVRFVSQSERERYLRSFASNRTVARPGALGHVRIPDWEYEVRMVIEDSNLLPAGVCVSCETQYRNDQDWESFIGSVPTMFAAGANAFSLGFEPFAGTPS